ncbi:DUF397 domain-containing protein [Streptomyces ipomoeae]|uniref:DUF397 domain-containing protein n=1 Tax=Streptomyces ipomoeae TaxID=103232 RepID=UPI001FD515BB|nr:DUF397 domain-containing protein [Streptomyces ipomoeae]MDX2932357.1 DUF397 domain-containing protein [Streptomyces ipomoeae]
MPPDRTRAGVHQPPIHIWSLHWPSVRVRVPFGKREPTAFGDRPALLQLRDGKSSYSGSNGGECVEVAPLTPHIAIRDSKNPAAGAFAVTPEAFSAFVSSL